MSVQRPSRRASRDAVRRIEPDHRAELLVADEYDLRNSLRSPYDPFSSAQAVRYFTRGILHAATVGGFPRRGAILLACCAVAGYVIGELLTVHTAMVRDGLWG